MAEAPEQLKYTEEHEWAEVKGDTVRIGITDYAQQQLGDVVFVQLPEEGKEFAVGDSVGEIESTKSVSELYVPVAGEITTVNTALDASPELINSDPYGEGWIFEVKPSDGIDGLLDATAYKALTDNE
ncbi:glycine cleavage system H protein [Herbihabitans rhizosphaerae]|uniref:Glycine cleavage system H protein n=1 Tax=Herbihabitans rhizosphaerae TaxID=1872711 RepID=A0A4Q7KBD3_9PSEU|nr:glycine cleavage system protein GcvH [Herbihabitans rhizosphaerae]RZS29827.1 glycine cleavage system H protein [Herbihabitans rhizosphaerae]